MLKPEELRREFPVLGQEVHSKPLIYLDNAASTQKPSCVKCAMLGWEALRQALK